MLQHILPGHKSVQDFEIAQTFPEVGHRVRVLNARQLDGLQQILLGIDDVTELQKRAEATLHGSKRRFRTMANAAPVMMWVADPDNVRTLAAIYRPNLATGIGIWLDRECRSAGPGPLHGY